MENVMKIQWMGAFCVGILFTLAGSLSAFELVRDGKAAAGITVDGTEPGLQLAAEEIAKYTKAVTGADISKAKPGIVITTVNSKSLPAEIRAKLADVKSDEAFFMGKLGENFYIVGTTGTGAWYGACDFIEKYLGVRWLIPYENGTFYSAKKSIHVPDQGRIERPAFPVRLFNQVGGWGFDPVAREWAGHNRIQAPGPWGMRDNMERYRKFHEQRMRLNRIEDGGHMTFGRAVPVKEYGKTHPEYFALVDGKRQTNAKIIHHCITNPKVKELLYLYICRYFERYGEETVSWNFGAPDSMTGWCQCENCRKLDNDAKINVSRRFHSVTQEIARRVWDKYPKAKLWTWAYWNYREIPEGVEIDPRTYVYFCAHGRCYAHALDDPSCARNVEVYNLLKRWMKISKRIFIYEYDTAVPYGSQPYEEVLLKDLRLYKKLGLLGRKEEIRYPHMKFLLPQHKKNKWQSLYWMRSKWQYWYLFGRGMWDPEINLEKSLEEIESVFYGKTYPAMKKYHAFRRKLWREAPGCMGFPTGDARTPRLLSRPGAKEQLLKYLDEAEKLAKGDTRLEKEIKIERGLLQDNWIAPNNKFREVQGRSLAAPAAAKAPVIDGKANDPAWGKAFFVTDFKTALDGKKTPCPPELTTSLGILSDRKNLYFLIQAKEPHPEKMKLLATPEDAKSIWSDELVEIFILPQNISMKYYQLAVTPSGALLELEQPGNNAKYKLNAEVKTSRSKDGWIIEMKVPTEKMDGTFANSMVWHLHAARTRHVKDEFPATGWSLDGTAYHDQTSYRPLTIGNPIIRNGDFEGGTDKKGSPKSWGINKNAKLVQIPAGGFAVRLQSGSNVSQIPYGGIFMPAEDCPVELSFRAHGKGKINVTNDRFTRVNGKNRHIRPEGVFQGNLSEKSTLFTAQFTVKAKEFTQLIFSVSGKDSECILDDVSLRLVR